jgi:hypothetical protein
MASATGIPEVHPATITSETAPLLGRPGDVTQKQDESIARNFISGESNPAMRSAQTTHAIDRRDCKCSSSWSLDCKFNFTFPFVVDKDQITDWPKLVALVWSNVLTQPVGLFTAHPVRSLAIIQTHV